MEIFRKQIHIKIRALFDLFLPRERQRETEREMKLPIIDLNALSQNDLVDAVRRACETNGFFILRNHSVRQATIREMRDASELFYALPVDVKMKAKQNANNRGYSPMMEEKLDLEANADSKEGYYIGRECEAWEEALPLRGKNVWLEEEEGEDATEEEKEVGGRFRRAMEAYYDEMVELSESFVPIFAQALGLEKTFFDDKFKPHNALLRPLKYGKVKSEGKQFGCGAHSDYGVLTLLWVQPGSEGLEIFDEKSNGWMSVDLGGEERREDGRPDDFVCNIGDLMQYWTNDRFKSTVHRVVTDGTKERYSAAFFYEPNYETEIEPILFEGEEPKYEKMTFLKYILAKYDATHEAFDSREKSTNA
jgi:isopenicillin N synthase-like dioxygenase